MKRTHRSSGHGASAGSSTIEADGGSGSRAPRERSREPRWGAPRFETLTHNECEAVLARNNVGRLAFSFHDRVDIEPIHYVFADGWLYGRTSQGSTLATLRHSHWVAFEVDEIEAVFQWRSVVVHGAFYPLSPDGPALEATAWERAIDLLRQLVPETWTSADPVAFRTVVFRIHIDAMTGRAATVSAKRGDR